MKSGIDDKIIRTFNHRPDAKIILYCIPYAGGGASIFRNWSLTLSPSIELCAFQLPGREDRINDSPFVDLNNLVDCLVQSIIITLDKPFAIFGHSMGALVGFEVARRLQIKHGFIPIRLFCSGRIAPHIDLQRRSVHQLPDAQFIDVIRNLNGTPEEALQNKELLQLLTPALRADFQMCETYKFLNGQQLEAPITVFSGIDDPQTNTFGLLEWSKHTAKGCNICAFPGGHFFINTARERILRLIEQSLIDVV